MSENTNIEWCDHTFNPWVGCTKVSPGCDHCYAEDWAKRAGTSAGVTWGGERRRTSEANWRKPLQWQAKAAEFMARHGRRQRVFCASLADVFDNQVPPAWRAKLFALIAATPDLDWLLLTKRIGNVPAMIKAPGMQKCGLPENVWLGATITSQAEADRDIRKLLRVDARVRFLSMEPLLGPVDLTCIPVGGGHGHHEFDPIITGNVLHRAVSSDPSVHWVIVGGESGPGARPMHPDWARSLRDQCAAAGVPFLFKQHGEWAPGSGDFGRGRYETAAIDRTGTIVVPGGFTVSDYPKAASSREGWSMVHRSGKKAAGRLLDGVEHNGFPEVRHG